MFHRRWIDRVRAIYVLRTTKQKDLPPVFEAPVPPDDVAIEHSIEGSHGDTQSIAGKDHSEISNSENRERPITTITAEPNPVRRKSDVPPPISA